MMKWNEIMNDAFRLVPCSIYDYEIMETWLEELALQGLVLENISCGIAKFRKQEPQEIRYRLTVIPVERMDVYEWIPGKSELINLCEAAGWKYICQRGHFGIFMTADETVEELHTEPELQHMDFKGYVKWSDLFWRGLLVLSFCFLMWKSFFKDGFLSMWAQAGSVLFFSLLGIMAANLYLVMRQWICPLILYRKLKQEGITHERKPWRGHAAGYRFVMVGLILLYTIGFGNAFYALVTDEYDQKEWSRVSLEEYQETLQIATMDKVMHSMFPDAVKQSAEWSGRVLNEKRFLTPATCIIDEEGVYRITDGTRIEYSLLIEYYETPHPWLAQQMAKEKYKCDQRLKWYHPVDTPELGLDYAVAYRAIMPTLLLVEDNKYVKIQLSTTATAYHNQVEPWCYVYADSLK